MRINMRKRSIRNNILVVSGILMLQYRKGDDVMAEGIAYQNKDIEFKILSESYRERSFEAYGLKIPRIKEVLPTNLPAVSADEMRMDNLFLLEDDTYALVDYESVDAVRNRIKYMNYISRVTQRLYREDKRVPVIRMIVIYTGDVESADEIFQVGCMTLRVEQVFVTHLPAEEIYKTVMHKLERGEKLTEQELMQLIILPLAGKGLEDKQTRIKQVIDLVKRIEDEREQKLVFSGLLVIADKFIDRVDAEKIRREITMTKVGRLIFEDGLTEGREEGRKEGRKEGEKKQRIIAVVNMMKLDIPEDKILTMYSEEELKAAKEVMGQKA